MYTKNAIVLQVWDKGHIIPNFSAYEWRWDDYGAVIKRSEYGNRDSKYGWEIDHITPDSRGGSDGIANLRPLQWENNVRKSNHRLI